jgi:hypothetical protein
MSDSSSLLTAAIACVPPKYSLSTLKRFVELLHYLSVSPQGSVRPTRGEVGDHYGNNEHSSVNLGTMDAQA